MKIGVISDTHVARMDQLPQKLVEGLKEVDLVVHLGDYTGEDLLNGLLGLGSFRGVFGNMDSIAIRARLPEKDVVEVGGKKLGIIHGWGPPWGMADKVRNRFRGVDAILYGHTHVAHVETAGGILFLNPGSATGRIPAPIRSYGVLTIGESIEGEIILIE